MTHFNKTKLLEALNKVLSPSFAREWETKYAINAYAQATDESLILLDDDEISERLYGESPLECYSFFSQCARVDALDAEYFNFGDLGGLQGFGSIEDAWEAYGAEVVEWFAEDIIDNEDYEQIFMDADCDDLIEDFIEAYNELATAEEKINAED